MMQGFRSGGGLQRFISVFSAVRNLFVAPRPKRSALCDSTIFNQSPVGISVMR
jgi:hypothetical protein